MSFRYSFWRSSWFAKSFFVAAVELRDRSLIWIIRAEYGFVDEEEESKINCGGWTRELSISTIVSLHPLEKSAININKGSKDFLIGKVNFEMLKQASKDHSKRKILARNQEMLKKHEIDDESGDINSNAFQKVMIGVEHIPGMTIFSRFRE